MPFRNYTNLTSFGVNSLGRNFYLRGKSGLRLGCWHILPHEVAVDYQDTAIDPREMERLMETLNNPVIVYLHGNSFDRSAASRCGLYNVLSDLGFHVLAVDYRGYGDSNGSPTEDGIIEDARELFLYAKSRSGSNHVFLWGHSMGTAIATATAMQLSESGSPPVGLILESPFNNLLDVVAYHPFATPFRWLPWFNQTVLRPLHRSGLNMSSDYRITKVSCPILILHAEDDHIIPPQLARKLRDNALAADRDVTYVEFEASLQFRHKYIHLANELPGIVTHFSDRCILKTKKMAKK